MGHIGLFLSEDYGKCQRKPGILCFCHNLLDGTCPRLTQAQEGCSFVAIWINSGIPCAALALATAPFKASLLSEPAYSSGKLLEMNIFLEVSAISQGRKSLNPCGAWKAKAAGQADLQVDSAVTEHEICVSEELSSVSKSNMETVITKMVQILDAQGISCFRCPKSIYKLFSPTV